MSRVNIYKKASLFFAKEVPWGFLLLFIQLDRIIDSKKLAE
jgi:hypothetical protein